MGQVLEIILFAFLAVYLFYRLWAVFGKEIEGDQERRDKNYSAPPPAEDNIIALPIKPKVSLPVLEDDSDFAPSVRDALHQIRVIKPDFNPHSFLKGARAAYKMTIEAFAKGDIETLTTLTSPKVLETFKEAISTRQQQQLTFNSEIETFEKIDIEAIELTESVAKISVRYRTRQINVTTDATGSIIDNPAKISVNVTDIWTFQKDLNFSDPNWILITTKSESYRDS